MHCSRDLAQFHPQGLPECCMSWPVGTSGAHAQRTASFSRTLERPSAKLYQRDHDMEREDEEQQSASKKRRADVSSFSIAATLSCDDSSRAGTDTEGKRHA